MVSMTAVKRVKYPLGQDGIEYVPGDMLIANSARDAEGLFIAGRAIYNENWPAKFDKAMRARMPQPAAEAVEAAPTVEETVPPPEFVPGHYQRRDMRAEDGRTGQATSSPSSRRGRPRKTQISAD